MNQTTTEKTIPLISFADGWWVENKIIHDLLIVKATDRNKDRDNDDDDGNNKDGYRYKKEKTIQSDSTEIRLKKKDTVINIKLDARNDNNDGPKESESEFSTTQVKVGSRMKTYDNLISVFNLMKIVK